ncbi:MULTISPECIES: acyltransferase [unclassified Mesorhizobium]|uniref:acyltransferase family protein n=1 Tax=unclassified Mesorhizobium TaxID=325217 RepID=UPI000FD46678|nr:MULTISPECIES: acyltransferase [unclassified Mesorhizobium]RVD19378.1 acyltransferase [Mesorhizobium sp. M7A.F.Ca.ET.027.02.1.1]RWC99905.1 MAG: acyltransferase [Mesorhizobium sp.]RWO62774.1 MAG: acyltransferase [Mesorhizobium sp.]RWO88307.1 MAG: acyltransferase [Mesorhizobium sp.]TIM99571.1 MAG: acyltransferase [Mesorhizobium sp.]
MIRNPALDGVRALAAMLVVVHHSQSPWMPGGFIGVDIFFVLSGFLITSLLMREADGTGTIAIGAFLLRRSVRLMPPLVMLLAAALIIGPLFWPDVPIGLIVAISILYLADYVSALHGVIPLLGHTWSLAVEEHFYLIWPMAVLGLAKLAQRSRIKALAIAFVVATLWRLGNAYHYTEFEMTAFRFDTRLSGLLLGALVSVSGISLKGRHANIVGLSSLGALVVLAFVATQEPVSTAYLQPLIDMASAGLVVSLLNNETMIARAFAWRPIVYIGIISYSVYLWHYPISRAALMYTNDWRMVLVVTLVLSLAIAALSWTFVEKPFQSWRRNRFAMV